MFSETWAGKRSSCFVIKCWPVCWVFITINLQHSMILSDESWWKASTMAPGGSFTSEIPGRYSSFMFWSTAALTLISCYIVSTHVYMSLATLNLRYQKVSQTLHGLRKKHRNTHTHTCSPVVIEITEITWVLLQAVQIVSLVLNYCAWISQVLFLQPSCFFLCCRDTMILGCLKCLPSLSLCIIMYYPIVSCRNFTQFTAQNAHSIPIIES